MFYVLPIKDKEEGKHEGEKKSKDKVHVMKQAGKVCCLSETACDKTSVDHPSRCVLFALNVMVVMQAHLISAWCCWWP